MEEKIDNQKIEKLAELSMLYFDSEEKKRMKKEINGIIEMLDKCAKFNLSSHPSIRKNKCRDLREDVVKDGLDIETTMEGINSRQKDFFAVDKVVEL